MQSATELLFSGSGCSIHLGLGPTAAAAGSFRDVYLVVNDIELGAAACLSAEP